ncbi:hypothetical protein LZ30DRAFT_785508 [Colletotrichum cereale]|nr:hypothetical protein LZ30DRAFT_785508 [Colletotrichum cereale]
MGNRRLIRSAAKRKAGSKIPRKDTITPTELRHLPLPPATRIDKIVIHGDGIQGGRLKLRLVQYPEILTSLLFTTYEMMAGNVEVERERVPHEKLRYSQLGTALFEWLLRHDTG